MDGLHKKFVFQNPDEVQLIAPPNGYAESYISTIKAQCLDHFVCLSVDHLDHINREWLSHYNFTRPHQGKEIGNEVLNVDFTPTTDGEIKREKKLGGIISHYYRAQACSA